MQNQTAQQVTEALKSANNVMVTVRNSPSVDELTAAVGLTLLLNHLNKHATTVFSGVVPSTIEFLQPEMAIETNTDSLRDFIIALDKSKADKLRYKVEDNVVRIFITPYRTSISKDDLEFSQGDFNVDVVVALGVVGRQDFDQAVTAHGRILHDATVIGVTKQDSVSQIGSINWQDPQASSICEMITGIVDGLGPNVMDGQIATALLTGIVAETDRFKNPKTTPQVLSLSSKLMAAGANQQLVAEKLEEPIPVEPITSDGGQKISEKNDGLLEIGHQDEDEDVQKIHIDEHGNLGLHQEEQQNELQVAEPRADNQQFDQENEQEQVKREFIPPSQQTPVNNGYPNTQESNNLESYNNELDDKPTIPPPKFDNSDQTSHSQKVIEPITPEIDSLQQPSELNEQEQDQQGNDNEFSFQPPPTVFEPKVEDQFNQEANNTQENNRFTAPDQLSEIAENNQTTENEVNAQIENNSPLPPPPLPDENGSFPAIATDPNSTLTDLEKSVDSSHVENVSEEAKEKIENYLGSTRAPAEQSEPIVVAPENNNSDNSQNKTDTLENLEDRVKQGNLGNGDSPKSENPAAPAQQSQPEVSNPNAAPAVPPPIMPQAPMHPQFYEADGSQSNPFLNPPAGK